MTIFGTTISPLFEAAQHILVFDVAQGKVNERKREFMGNLDVSERLAMLQWLGVKVLVCGAIGGFVQHALFERGIDVYSWVSGEVEDVIGFLVARFCPEKRKNTHGVEQDIKIAVSSDGPDLDSVISKCFGQGKYLHFVCPKKMKHEFRKIQVVPSGGQMGLRAAHLVLDSKADFVFAGHCGPNAFGILSAGGVQVVLGVGGRISESVESFNRGELCPVSRFSDANPFGRKNMESNQCGRGTGEGQGRG
ncbi:MAG: NifB/NifX family molybdenum-iron cluster-binding protein, partial [Pseudomonadota bacterium]